jgi:hypothetical protein
MTRLWRSTHARSSRHPGFVINSSFVSRIASFDSSVLSVLSVVALLLPKGNFSREEQLLFHAYSHNPLGRL